MTNSEVIRMTTKSQILRPHPRNFFGSLFVIPFLAFVAVAIVLAAVGMRFN